MEIFSYELSIFTVSSGNQSNQLNYPQGIAYDPRDGALFISDTGNHRIMRYSKGATYILLRVFILIL